MLHAWQGLESLFKLPESTLGFKLPGARTGTGTPHCRAFPQQAQPGLELAVRVRQDCSAQRRARLGRCNETHRESEWQDW